MSLTGASSVLYSEQNKPTYHRPELLEDALWSIGDKSTEMAPAGSSAVSLEAQDW